MDLLDYLEESGLLWLITARGYEQESLITSRQRKIGAILDGIGLILIVKVFTTAFLTDQYISLLLGDIFIGSPSHGIQNMLLIMFLVLTVGLRLVGFLTERLGKIGILRIFHQLRVTQFDCQKFMLRSVDCSHMRKFFYVFGFFYKYGTPSTCLAVSSWLAFAYLTNPINHTSLITSLTTGLWTVLTALIYIGGAYPTIWLFAHNVMIITFANFSLTSVCWYGLNIVKANCKVKRERIYKFLAQQNRIYNFIYQHTVDLGKVFFYGVLVVSSTGNFIMFVSIFIGTGNYLFDYVILAVGIMTFNSIGVINILAAITANKISSCQCINYSIARRCKYSPRLSLKLMLTCERLNVSKIGFNLGGIYILDSEHFLLYLLENAGLMLMFITNFNKSNPNPPTT